VTIPPQQQPRRPAVTWLAWALCILSMILALASVALASFNGENLLELVANHHAIGILNALVLPLIGALIVVGDRHHLLAWLLIVAGVSLAVYNLAAQYAPLALGLTSRRLSLPGGDLASWLTSWTNLPGIVILAVFLILLFPDGRPPSRRWRPVVWAGAVVLVVPTAILAVGYWPLRGPQLITQEGSQPPLVSAMFWTAFQGCAAARGHQRRRARAAVPPRRRGAAPADQVVRLRRRPEHPAQPVPRSATLGAVPGVPGHGAAAGRAWHRDLPLPAVDIDRLVNRTLVYGLLTAILGTVYAGLVLVLGQLFGGLGTQTPSWAVAGATLAVAALFQPARRRIQQTVDRRFNRRKYNAAKTIEAFSIRLRDQVDLDTLSAELLAAVDQTMQPTSASLWLRPSA
jgi:hypothetical protein